MLHHDVVIIGAGVAGLSQALALVQAGFCVAVLDQGQRPSLWQADAPWDNRVFALTRTSQYFLEDLHLWGALHERRMARYQAMHLAWQHQAPAVLSATQAAQADLGHIVEQSVLRDALLEALEQSPACHFYWQQTWQTLTVSDQGSTVRLPTGQTLSAALLIAADGAQSAVRQFFAMPQVTWSHHAKAIVTTLRSDQPHQGTARQWFLPTGTLALLPLSDAQVCSLVWSLPVDLATEYQALSDIAFARLLSQHTDGCLGHLQPLTARQSFPLRAAINESFIQPGLAYVADAAHVIHPLAGQGLNLGLVDVQHLTETLVKAKSLQRPLGHEAVLKPYARARRAAAWQMASLMTVFDRGGQSSAGYAKLTAKVMALLCQCSVWQVLITTFALHALTE